MFLRQTYLKNILFQNFNLKINNNDRIALVGKNNAGKSMFTKTIDGVYKVDRNQLKIVGNIYAFMSHTICLIMNLMLQKISEYFTQITITVLKKY